MALVQENRWEARPKLAVALKAAIYGLPLVAGAATALLASRLLQNQYPEWSWLLVSALTFPIAFAVVITGERLLRRLLPLAMLLKLSLLFPDQVPSRLGTAMRASSPKRLLARLEENPEGGSVAEQVITLVAALNAHDRRTRGHSERVRAVTMLIADELEIVGEDRDKLEWAALLHDLGKLEVPSEILNKKGRPTDEEWQTLRAHPAAGPSHASGIAEWLGEWIHAMDQHHERFDGSGYPIGLAADQIAMSGRIVAVSDAFEVMTATRSYKVPMSTQAARDELVKCAGTHFDPAVVRSFMAVSLGDVHRALGPSSWIASLPFSGVAAPVAGLGNSIVGGSVTPALAAAAALTVLTGSAAVQLQGDLSPAGANVPPAVELVDEPADIFDDVAAVDAQDDEFGAPPDGLASEATIRTSRTDSDGEITWSLQDDETDPDDPATTVPAISVPPTLPAVTVPPITVPPVTVPPVTAPPVTLPPVTVPPPTLPPVTVPPVGDLVDDVANDVVDPIVDDVVDPIVDDVVDDVIDEVVPELPPVASPKLPRLL